MKKTNALAVADAMKPAPAAVRKEKNALADAIVIVIADVTAVVIADAMASVIRKWLLSSARH